MIHLLSPAKSLDFEKKLPLEDYTQAEFLDSSQQLIKKLSGFSQKKIKSLMSISDSLADLNVQRYQEWEGKSVILHLPETFIKA